MIKRSLIALQALGTALTLACTPGKLGASERPNIVFLLADDQNFRSIGAYGNPEVKTPQMDRLAAEGITFDKHYNTTAICMASRGSIFSGMYEYKTGTNFEHGDMEATIWEKTYPMLLREAGYLTGFAGKFGLLVEGIRGNRKPGMPSADFDTWGGALGQSDYQTAKNPSMAEYAEQYPHSTLSYGAFGQDFIKRAAYEKKPFCLSISFKAPHLPTTPDPQFDHVYAGKTFTKPANYGREHSEHLSPQSKQGRQYKRFRQWNYDTNYDEVMATYYQQIYAIDVAIGMIREELDAQGVADNTVIIYTSDNGFLCGAHGYGSKVLPMEDSARAPLIILDPRSDTAGKQLRSRALTANLDFMPTILELAGLPVPGNVDGKSLLPLLRDPTSEGHEQLAFINVYGAAPTRSLSVITPDLKYTYWWYGSEKMEPTEDLFDLGQDPLELTNLAKHPEAAPKLEMMREKYDEELSKWKTSADPTRSHASYGTLFDRSIPWQEKSDQISKRKKN